MLFEINRRTVCHHKAMIACNDTPFAKIMHSAFMDVTRITEIHSLSTYLTTVRRIYNARSQRIRRTVVKDFFEIRCLNPQSLRDSPLLRGVTHLIPPSPGGLSQDYILLLNWLFDEIQFELNFIELIFWCQKRKSLFPSSISLRCRTVSSRTLSLPMFSSSLLIASMPFALVCGEA